MRFPRPNHPMLVGLRLLAMRQGAGVYKNWFPGRANEGTVVNSTATKLGRWPGFTMTNAGNSKATFSPPSSYGLGGQGITIMARVKAASAPPNNGGWGVVTNRGAVSPANSGLGLFLGNTPGASENGYVFFVHNAAGGVLKCHDNVGASNLVGKSLVLAATYEAFDKTVKIYHNGQLKGAQQDTGSTWVPWDNTQNIVAGAFGPLNPLLSSWDGDLGWIAIFDRALPAEDLELWAQDDRWPFLEDEGLLPNVTGTTYRNRLGLSDSAGLSGTGSVKYTNSFSAEVATGGDVVSVPGAGTPTYRNTLGLVQAYTPGTPLLVKYANTVRFSGRNTLAPVVTYRNSLGLRQGRRTNVDGRVDLLGTSRYRR